MSQNVVINNSFNNDSNRDKKNGTKSWWIVLLLAILGSPVIAAYIKSHSPSTTKSATSPSGSEITFVGRVVKSDQEAIPNATVIAIADETPGQTLLTDANGQFHIQLPGITHSLSLTIKAAGYQIKNIDADIHRTGPEILILTPQSSNAAATSHSKTSDQNMRKNKEKPNNAVQDCKDSICVGGSNSGSLTNIHIDTPIRPDRHITQVNGEQAVAILNKISPGPAINIHFFDGDSESTAFAEQLGSIFVDSGWNVTRVPEAILALSYETSKGYRSYTGEYLACYHQPTNSEAATTVVKALSVAGYPCKEIPSTWAPDIEIFAGKK